MTSTVKTINKTSSLKGTVLVPGDKSISHRAVMLGAIAEGVTEISHFLPSEDCLSTIGCMRELGVRIEITEDTAADPAGQELHVTIYGRGLHGLKAPSKTLDAGNSGTTTRLLSGILAGQPFISRITGDSSLTRRPMKRIIEPLTLMGGHILSENNDGCAPLVIGGQPLHGLSYKTPVASAQVKSCLLLAGLYADAPTSVTEPALSRDHTERMLRAFGADVRREGLTATVYPMVSSSGCLKGQPACILRGQTIEVPGDISSAAYFLAAGLLVPGSDILLENVGINPTRSGILKVIEKMGGSYECLDRRAVGSPGGTSDHDDPVNGKSDDPGGPLNGKSDDPGRLIGVNSEGFGEPVADIRVKACRLYGTEIGGDLIPTLIDEIPVIAVMAAFAEGTTVIKDAAELKVKESDRIALITSNLRAMGADVTATDDGMIIHGRPIDSAPEDCVLQKSFSPSADETSSSNYRNQLHGARIRTLGDHRIAMAFAVAGLLVGDMEIDDPECVAVSYPGFYEALEHLAL